MTFADHAADPSPVEIDVTRAARARSQGDVLRLLVGLSVLGVGLILATFGQNTIGGVEADVVEAFTGLPDRVEQAVVGIAQLIAAVAPVVIAVALAARRRWMVLVSLVLVSVAASLVWVGVETWLDIRESTATIARRAVTAGWITDPSFPTSATLASSVAVVTLASVWLSRPWKRFAWMLVGVLVALRLVSSSDPVLDLVLAVGVGMTVGALGLVVFGAPNPEPPARSVVAALRDCGIAVRRLTGLTVPQPGSRCYRVEDDRGRVLFVKLRTPDDRSADLLNRIVRAVRMRSGEAGRAFSTVKRRAEHEALLLLRVVNATVRSPGLVAVTTTENGSAILVEDFVDARTLADIDADEMSDELLRSAWSDVARLHDARIAHRSLSAHNLLVDGDERVWIVDYDAAELAARPATRRRDVAELLISLALVVGVERAIGPAIDELGAERVGAVLPLLQPLALSPVTRRGLRADPTLLDRLRGEIQGRTGTKEVELERLERVRPRTLVMIGAAAAGIYFLLPQVANIEATVDAFSDADWRWLVLLMAASAATYLFAAVTFVGSVADPVPFAPSLRAQVAASFAGFIAPANTGGAVLGVRFLQRAGVDLASATASVGLKQIAGLVVHLTLMFSFIAWTGSSGVGSFSLPDSTIVLLVVALVLALAGVALAIRAVRRRVMIPLVRAVRSAGSSLVSIFTSPTRVAQLIGGSFGISLTYMVAMVAAVEAFGGGLTVPQIGAAYFAGAAIGSAAPTPGGLGAMEAALIAGLTGFGMDRGPAVSAVLTFRLATYWLPILPGWGTFNWMQAREEL